LRRGERAWQFHYQGWLLPCPLGARFIAAVQSAVDHIVVAPQACRVMEEDVRRFLTKVFPYAVLYTIERDYILIVAVMHCHREPGYWHHRIQPA